MNRVSHSWITPQWLASSRLTSISSASSPAAMGVGVPSIGHVQGVGQAVGGVGGDDQRAVAQPAERTAVAAERLVLPTPPLPE